jgi:hypothetical protein
VRLGRDTGDAPPTHSNGPLLLVPRGLLSFALMLGLAACAPEVVRQPAQLTPTTGGSGATIEVAEEASVAVGTGYSRVIRRGSVWSRVGRLVQGEV